MSEPGPAVDLILEHLPHVPFWPQLTTRGPWEDMILQAAPGLPCLKVDPEERTVKVDPAADRTDELTRFYEADMAEETTRFALTADTAPGYFELVDRVTRRPGDAVRLKGHITGPITFCLAATDAEGRAAIHDAELAEAFARGLGLKAAWQVHHFPPSLPPGISSPPIRRPSTRKPVKRTTPRRPTISESSASRRSQVSLAGAGP